VTLEPGQPRIVRDALRPPLLSSRRAEQNAIASPIHRDLHPPIVMPLLFSYGTLQDEAVQLATFGRRLTGHPDELMGFERSLISIQDAAFVAKSGKSHHAIVRPTGIPDCRVAGMALELTDDELAKADAYEPAGYTRVSTMLASGKPAWVYADTRLS
jgi:hypothetical protein